MTRAQPRRMTGPKAAADAPNLEELDRARAVRDLARQRVDTARRLVARREAGASSLHVAEYELLMAQRRLDALTSRAELVGDQGGDAA